eukprot:augustus_masked-scaffold_1-processed-gene-16.6-mRNA-1 protein AED:1.00 eAED:1.00 QI:0/0/0/0/1/1/2/0/370
MGFTNSAHRLFRRSMKKSPFCALEISSKYEKLAFCAFFIQTKYDEKKFWEIDLTNEIARSTSLRSQKTRAPPEPMTVPEIEVVSPAKTGSGKAAPKKPRKKRLAKRACEFYTKTPRYFTPSKYVVCEDDLRQAQRKMKGKRAVEMLEKKNIHQSSTFPLLLMIALSETEVDKVPFTERVAHMLAAVPNFRENKEVSFGQLVSMRKKAPIRLVETNTPTWFFRSGGDVIDANVQHMADRGMAVLKGDMPKLIVVKADLLVEKSLVTPKRKIRRSEHQLTDKESRFQSRISSLTNKNDRLKAQAHTAESVLRDKNTALMRMAVNETKKKHKAEIKRLLDEVKNLKGLYCAEKEKNQDLQQEVFDKDSVVETY